MRTREETHSLYFSSAPCEQICRIKKLRAQIASHDRKIIIINIKQTVDGNLRNQILMQATSLLGIIMDRLQLHFPVGHDADYDYDGEDNDRVEKAPWLTTGARCELSSYCPPEAGFKIDRR